MDLPLSEGDRKLLAAILMREDEELTPELLDGAVKALRRIWARRRQEQVQRELAEAGRVKDSRRVAELSAELLRLKRLLRDPGMADEGGQKRSA
jgi:hypothetical protein